MGRKAEVVDVVVPIQIQPRCCSSDPNPAPGAFGKLIPGIWQPNINNDRLVTKEGG